MFTATNLYLFFIASLMLNLTPGNDMLYVTSRSLSQGTRAGLFSAMGIFIGCLVHIVAAIFGLSAVIAQSAFWFQVIKYAGAAYLIYLGIKTFITRSNFNRDLAHLPKTDKWKLLKQGIITNVLNPKVALFFLSFLPQFVDVHSSNLKMQLFTLGIWFDLQGTFILILVALLLGNTTNFIKRYPKFWNVQQKITGAILVGLGIKIALSVEGE